MSTFKNALVPYSWKKKPQQPSSKGFVYFLYCPAINQKYHLVKIGQTKNDVTKRIQQLQTGNPFTIKVFAVIHVDGYKQIEKELHAKYKSRKYNNEWFHLTFEEIEQEIRILERASTNKGCYYRCVENYSSQHKTCSMIGITLTVTLSRLIVYGYQLIDRYFIAPPTSVAATRRRQQVNANRNMCRRNRVRRGGAAAGTIVSMLSSLWSVVNNRVLLHHRKVGNRSRKM